MAKYKKRSDGRYATNIDIGFTDDGKRKRKTVYGKTIAEIESKIAEVRYKLQQGNLVKTSSMPFGEYAKIWLKSKTGLAWSTYYAYEKILENHIDPIRRIPLQKLVKSDVQDCIDALNGHYDTQKKLKLTIDQVLEFAIDDNLLSKNVARKTTIPKSNNVQKKRPLTENEKEAIKQCEFSLKERAFVDIAYYTGMRRGEILALSRNDINFKTCEINVNKSLTFVNNNHPLVKATKTKNSVRSIPMPNRLVDELKQYISTLDTLYLFTGNDGQLMGHSAYTRFWAGIYKKINNELGGNDYIKVTDLSLHMFRHNYATMLYYNNIDVKQAQLLLGHSNIKTTLEIYTHFVSDSTVKDKLSDLVM